MTASARTRPARAATRGLALAELAARNGLTEHAMGELLRPFVEHGLVAVRGHQLVVEDGAVIAAFAQRERAT